MYFISVVLFLTTAVFFKDRNHHLHHHFLMAVAPASLADKIIVLDGDDDEDESLNSSCSISTSFVRPQAKEVCQPEVQQPVHSHITQSPFVSAKKDAHVLQAENERLFGEVSLVIFRIIMVFIRHKNSLFLCCCLLNVLPSFSFLLVCGSLLG